MIHYQERKLSEVLNYFARDFRAPDGDKIVSAEAFVDPVKGVVVFKLITLKDEKKEGEK